MGRRFATVQNDKYLEAMEYEIPLPARQMYQRVQENIEKIEMWQKEGWKLVRKVKTEGIFTKTS